MSLLDCLHVSDGVVQQVCVHLLEKPDVDYSQVFTGEGCTYWLTCKDCAKQDSLDATPWQTVCPACFGAIADEGWWDGIRGTPAIREEPAAIAFTHRLVSLSISDSSPLRLAQPVPDAFGSVWMGLMASGSLMEINLDTGSYRFITQITASDIDIGKQVSLVCSPDGKFLCLTETLGSVGVVIERDTARRTLRLQRDGYHSNLSPFPAVFTVQDSQTLLIHGTAWNRLDISDPVTGKLLTERSPTSYKRGEERPVHYLDYFHGSLLVSPTQEYIADDGWIWGPSGEVRSWRIRSWLAENVWESEDGPSRRRLAQRVALWGVPLCWIDGQTVAIWGYGNDEEWVIPAVLLFDVVSGEKRGWFPGPEVAKREELQRLRQLRGFGGTFFFDQYLFAVSEAHGVSVWDVVRGARLHQDASLVPVAYHPGTKEFLTILADGTLQVSRLIEG